MPPRLNAPAILTTSAGGILLYSGIKGMSVSMVARDLITGRNPAKDAALLGNVSPSSPEGQALLSGVAPPPNVINRAAGDPHPKPSSAVKQATPNQMFRSLVNAGFAPAKAVVMTAIGLAESHGNVYAHCLNCVPGVREDSRGVWQINVDAHPQYAMADLFNLDTNAAAAYAVSSQGKSFTPWSTYTSGAYRTYLSQAMAAAHG